MWGKGYIVYIVFKKFRLSWFVAKKMRKVFYNRCLDIETRYLNLRPTSSGRSSRGVSRRRREQNGTSCAACPVVTAREAVGPRNSFWLNLCIAARACAPHLDLRGPFCAVINAPGPLHFHPTARRCTARRQDECIAPSSPTCRSSVPGPIRSRVCKSDRVHIREKETAKTREERFFHYTSAGVEQSSEK